ncbi:MAG TPA: hypothetical protein VEX13_03985 [Chloroflexia bacterium]|nr:hypothetical protein [Chloroflexia bacterium]
MTNSNDSGANSLRQAILNANANGGLDTITFNIAGTGVHTINLSSALPAITGPVSINGYTQPGSSQNTLQQGNNARLRIVLNGQNAGTDAYGLTINAGGSTVQGLVISSFRAGGIRIETNGGNIVSGNFIGTDHTGTDYKGNQVGIEVMNSPYNTIGGTTPGKRNLISANSGSGLRITGTNATGNVVQGNYIGTDASGTAILGNGINSSIGFEEPGVFVQAPSTTIGGTAAGAGNLISGNFSIGLNLWGSEGHNNVVQGNYIGTNASGISALRNTRHGIAISYSPNNTIGGTVAGARNVISGNEDDGIRMTSESATGNVVQGNYIGTNASGTGVVPNLGSGVSLDGASGNNVGGTSTAARNIISGNYYGVKISAASNILVQGNYIGTNASGTSSIGNQQVGIFMGISGNIGSNNNTIGGATPGARNIIAGNASDGIDIIGADYNGDFSGTKIQGNYIGTDVSGTAALGNFKGIYLTFAEGVTIGGNTAAEENVIAFNRDHGIQLGDPSFQSPQGGRVAVARNSIFDNAGLGIDLLNNVVTPNDTCDTDGGPNGLQNYPILSTARSDGSTTTITGTLNSTAGATYTIRFFSSTSCDPSGYGEGKTFLGSATVTTGSNCNASFNVTLPVAVPSGRFITGTATNAGGSTSEFSICIISSATVPSCTLQFSDVPPSNTFYPYVRCLACRGIDTGYQCGGPGEPCNANNDRYFRPDSLIKRDDLAHMVAASAGFNENPGSRKFQDVPTSNPYYNWVQRMANRGLIGGYPCGTVPSEPCVGPANLAYYRPAANATRGQISKIVSNGAGYNETPAGQLFEDVPPSHAFYQWVQRLANRGVMGGYPCGGAGEPCGVGNKPYFRWGNNSTRGQVAKITANTFFPSCQP